MEVKNREVRNCFYGGSSKLRDSNEGLDSSCLTAPKQSCLVFFYGISSAFIGLSTLLFSTLPAYALSVTTTKTIVGTEPYILLSDGVTKLISLDELLGFTMPHQDGSSGTEQIDASMAGTPIIVPVGMKYKDVVTLITADGSLYSASGVIVGDDEGDASLAANISALGQLKATWYNGSTQVTNLNSTLSVCGGPYTLKIEIPTAVSVNTKYGDPNTKFYGSSSVTYTFISSNPGICYFKPAEMTVFTGTEGVDIKYAAGYNPLVWEYDAAMSTHRGFKVESGFPSTGFYKAEFSVIGPGSDQSKYRCSSTDDGGKIILSGAASSSLGAKCKVTYNVRARTAFTAGGTPTIDLEYNTSGSTWVQVDSYTIPTPVLWARPLDTGQGSAFNSELDFSGSYTAAQICDPSFNQTGIAARAAAGALFFTRAELTNAPQATGPAKIGGYFSRDIGSFTGEWGRLYYSYTGSGWGSSYDRFWAGEAYSDRFQFSVTSDGSVNGYSAGSNTMEPVCRD